MAAAVLIQVRISLPKIIAHKQHSQKGWKRHDILGIPNPPTRHGWAGPGVPPSSGCIPRSALLLRLESQPKQAEPDQAGAHLEHAREGCCEGGRVPESADRRRPDLLDARLGVHEDQLLEACAAGRV